jgi:hypothetical protein
MRQIIWYLFLFVEVVLSSCGRSELGPKEYAYYVQNPNNGLLVTASLSGVQYTLQYQPAEYLALLQLKDFSLQEDTFQEQYKRFKGIEHYVFHIDKKEWDNLTGKARDTARIRKGMTEYMDFKIQNDIKLVEGDDTIPCGISECESSMGMLPYYSFIVGFNARNFNGDREFIFWNKDIGTGNVKMEIKARDINRIPKLKING